MTFDTLVEKTKRMLGDNYRGDKTPMPVYSTPAPIEGHTDASLIISNGNFTEAEVKLITEKTQNYAWWVANKGYMLDNSQKEIPALFIYGSETPDSKETVLNFNGLTTSNFYNLVDRTDTEGNVNNTLNHLYVQFTLDGEVKTYETDREGNNGGLLDIDGVTYNIYSGRLYPEDVVVNNKGLYYPIYLYSNLDYYYIPEVGKEGKKLEGAHDAKPTIQNNLEILKDICEMVEHEAGEWTNRPVNTSLLNDTWPVIVKCSCMAYLNRGAEGLNSQSELGQQNVYSDWITLMHQQITNRRYVL